MSLGPVIDGVSLPRHPEEALTAGSTKDIPILIGTNKDTNARHFPLVFTLCIPCTHLLTTTLYTFTLLQCKSVFEDIYKLSKLLQNPKGYYGYRM
jgi:hypothetical protein